MAFLFASHGAFAAPRTILTRTFSTRPALLADKPPFAFGRGPAPPPLPKEEQEIFEDLQRKSTGAFSTSQINQSPDAEAEAENAPSHPDTPKSVTPEFEGDKNPRTGEVGGPKNEPLRWGSDGDWSYRGRVTDF